MKSLLCIFLHADDYHQCALGMARYYLFMSDTDINHVPSSVLQPRVDCVILMSHFRWHQCHRPANLQPITPSPETQV